MHRGLNEQERRDYNRTRATMSIILAVQVVPSSKLLYTFRSHELQMKRDAIIDSPFC